MCIVICTLLLSRPARGAWVEISLQPYWLVLPSSRPARGAWVEILVGEFFTSMITSRPARGAWVEIKKTGNKYVFIQVAPRKGRVG